MATGEVYSTEQTAMLDRIKEKEEQSRHIARELHDDRPGTNRPQDADRGQVSGLA
jgi:hypothetical protein